MKSSSNYCRWAGLGAAALFLGVLSLPSATLDVAPFGLPLPEGNGVMWEDPREIHRVVVHFKSAVAQPAAVHLEYWGSRWPEQHLPKNREPGGGDVGWMELGNWHNYGWRVADAEVQADGQSLAFTFRPVTAREFPKVQNYPAPFRYTLKVRVTALEPLPALEKLEAFTDSVGAARAVRLAWKEAPHGEVSVDAFNGRVESLQTVSPQNWRMQLQVAANPDPSTFDRTLITVRTGSNVFTFKTDDLDAGALFVPAFGVAVLPEKDLRNYAAVAAEQKARGARTLYDRVAELPEHTWQAAWNGMPPKKSHIYFPLGLDGGRQRFRLHANGSIDFRSNDHYLRGRPGQDTPRLDLEKPDVGFSFGLPGQPLRRTLEEASLPICISTWETDGVEIQQTALVTALSGTRADGPTPPADVSTVFLAEFVFSNKTAQAREVKFPIEYRAGGQGKNLEWVGRKGDGMQNLSLTIAAGLRGLVAGAGDLAASFQQEGSAPLGHVKLAPGQAQTLVLKIPYLVLTEQTEKSLLAQLNFETERQAVAAFWHRRLDQSARLITPEPMLNEFYRSHSMHLLVNCEREPGSNRRFARVGSFGYGAYGNESCMMVVDLDRRGYHKEAQDCLDAWLHYQGTVALPGSFAGHAGVLYGAGGYEAGGYNQHHGWILWMLAEHYRFTRDEPWLRGAAPGLVKACDWIIRETARTASRHPLEQGLLPAGSLEDIGDWWTWLSTSCYTWRGLDSAAWALEQIQHPEAARIRAAATAYHTALLKNFRAASQLSPVVRLRDGTAVPQIPSYVHRRGRSFGWICQTLEGAIHLLITRALDAHAPEAEWILKDYEDNLYLSNQYGYTLPDFERDWFSRGGMSMQACLLLDVEPYLDRDNVKHALRALFNAQSVSYFPDVRMNTEHALPEMGDWRGDHFKSSDESNTAGWLRQLFVREEGNALLLGPAVPRDWLRPGRRCGLERAATYFGPVSVVYEAGTDQITANIEGPTRNAPPVLRVRFREAQGRPLAAVTVNGQPWTDFKAEWVNLPGAQGRAVVVGTFAK